jgi:aminoacrylate hydrolase
VSAPASDAERLTIGGLAVTCHGPADGEPVLMSAGLGGQGAYWGPQVAALKSAYRVILYDHRGTGDSDRALGETCTVADFAQDMLAILDGLDIARAHIVGHAAGGVAGLDLMGLAPERVASLTVVNGWAKADPYFKRCFEIRLALYEAGGAAAYLKAQPLFLYPAEWMSTRLDEIDRSTAAHVPGFQSEAALRARINALAGFELSEAASQAMAPTLLISAKDDMLVPAFCSRKLGAQLAAASLVELAWGGHAVNVTDPEAFNAPFLRFLRSHRLLETAP